MFKCTLFRKYWREYVIYLKKFPVSDLLGRLIFSFDPMTTPGDIPDHMRSNAFFSTFDRIEMGHWGWSQCGFLAVAHRQLCNINFLCNSSEMKN